MALVGAPLVTPVALQNALLQSRRVGNPNDPYGTIAAMRSVGDSYINSQNQLQELAQSANKMAEMDSGLYLVQAQEKLARAQTNTATEQDKLEHLQDLQRAVKDTLREGIKRQDPRFMLSVQSKLQNYHAMKTVQPEVDASIKQMQIDVAKKAYLESRIPQAMARQIAIKAYPEVAASWLASTGQELNPTGQEGRSKMQQLYQQALENVKREGVNVSLDPITGIATIKSNPTAENPEGKNIEVPPKELANLLKMSGNPVLSSIYDSFLKQQREVSSTNAQTTNAQARVNASERPLGRNVQGLGRVSDEGIKHLSDSYKARRDIIKADPDMTTAQKLKALDDIDAKLNQLHVETEQNLGAPYGDPEQQEILRQRLNQGIDVPFDPAVRGGGRGIMGPYGPLADVVNTPANVSVNATRVPEQGIIDAYWNRIMTPQQNTLPTSDAYGIE